MGHEYTFLGSGMRVYSNRDRSIVSLVGNYIDIACIESTMDELEVIEGGQMTGGRLSL